MDLDSAGTQPKRARSKAKAAEGDAAPKPAAAPRSRKPKTVEVTAITAIATPSEDELIVMIATAAYFMAQQRNFEPGYELEDWLEAERQIRTLHT